MKSEIGKKYEEFLDALINTSLDCKDCSKQIYFDLFKIHLAQWKYKVKFRRKVDFSIADIFQDIIAHYLKSKLPKNFDVLVEEHEGKVRPDILIKKDGVNWAAIEVKTTIGWNRELVNNYKDRLILLSKTFNIPIERTFYVFESYSNVSKSFNQRFENKKSNDEIHKFIFPLFKTSPIPYYAVKADKRQEVFEDFTDKQIEELYNLNKYIEFENIIKKIVG